MLSYLRRSVIRVSHEISLCVRVDTGVRVWFAGVVFFQAKDGIRDLVRSRGLGDVYKRQHPMAAAAA